MKMNFNFSIKRFLLLSLNILILFTAGCLPDENEHIPVELAYVTFYHVSPDTEDLNIIAANYGTINSTPFSYGDYTGYEDFIPGSWTFKFAEAANSTSILMDTTLTLTRHKLYSIFVADSLKSLETIILGDSAQEVEAGNAMVRFLHLSPDTPPADVFIDGVEIFSDQSFRDATAFTKITSGIKDLEFRTSDGSNVVLLTVEDRQIQDKGYYTFVLKGFTNPPAENSNMLSISLVKN